MPLNYDDLEMAVEFASFGESEAYICVETGQIYLSSDAVDVEIPDDLDEEGKYLVVPSKRDLGLGKPLVLDFVADRLPGDLESVHSYFRSRGAYSKYKALLEERKILEQWYEYEQESTKQALLSWCQEHAIDVSI
jgi:hypothetical protein